MVVGADIDAVAAAPQQDVWYLLSLLFLLEQAHMPRGILLEFIFRGDSSCSFSIYFPVLIEPEPSHGSDRTAARKPPWI